MPERIYLDANATTPLLPQVFEAMRPYLLESFGNASSTHLQGQRARSAIERAREQVAALLGARAGEIVFTSGGTESDNLALFGTLAAGDHLVTATTEHHAVLHAAQVLERRGVTVTCVPCGRDGRIDPGWVQDAMRPNTRLVSVMHANNETGTVQPVAALARVAKAGGAHFHTDAVQSAGKLTLDLRGELAEVDLLAISGHKLYAPQGTGALFVRKGTTLEPLHHGGNQERQRRAGTENLAGIVALGEAAEQALRWLAGGGPEGLARLRDRLEDILLRELAPCGVNGEGTVRVANTTNLHFAGVDAEALLIALDLRGVAVSAGSACQSGATEPSHVLTAMGLASAEARGSIRISLTRGTTEAEVDRAAAIMVETVRRLRSG